MGLITLNSAAMQLVTEMGHSLSEYPLIAQFERYFNDSRRHILTFADWPFRDTTDTTISTVAGTATYSLTTNACEIREVRLGGSLDKSLIMTSIEELSRDGVDLELQGEPSYWYPNGYTASTQKIGIGLWPIPSAVYSVIPYITLMPIDLTSDSTIDLPESCYTCLREGARYYCELDQGRPQNADRALRMFDASLRALRYKYATLGGEESYGEYTDVKPRRGLPRFLPGRYPRVF